MPNDVLLRLAGIQLQVSRGEPLDPADTALLDMTLVLFAQRLSRSEAVSLRAVGLEARNSAIALAASHYVGSIKLRAAQLRDDALLYCSTAWRRHRSSTSCPDEIRGHVQAEFWLTMKTSPRFHLASGNLKQL
jgi:hypothetical protein